MLEKIEKHLEDMDIENLSLLDLKIYTETVIMLDRYKTSKDLVKNLDKYPFIDLTPVN